MPHVFELAPSARAKCRGCGQAIAKGELRFGEAELGVAHRRVPRLGTAERASSGRATCRACKELIAKDTWRIALVLYEEGRFVPSGFVHVGCVPTYCETVAVMPRVRHFSPALTDSDAAEIEAQLRVN